MDRIKTIMINGENYGSIRDIVNMIRDENDIEKAISILKPEIKIEIKARVKPKEELSDFNKKLKKGLNWNPKKEG